MLLYQCMRSCMSTNDINSHLNRIYGFEVSAETVICVPRLSKLITLTNCGTIKSRITDKILPIAKETAK